MRFLAGWVIAFFITTQSWADYGLGMTVDSSTNMLMRPGGLSGAITNIYGLSEYSLKGFEFLYNLDAGLVQHYEGLQYHRHTMDLTFVPVSKEDARIAVKLEGVAARYGDISVLSGYNELNFSSSLKSYLGESTLFRCGGEVLQRVYRDFDTESFVQADTYLRLDRFFQSGTTLRGQIDGGVRRYSKIPKKSPVTTVFTFRGRVAQSLGPRAGVWLEIHDRLINSGASPDTSVIYERRFLEDEYKCSALGAAFHLKYLLKDSGTVQFETNVEKKAFGESEVSSYWYLPQNGWSEWEKGVSLSFSYRPFFFPEIVHPLLVFYHRRVDSSISDLSYRSSGVTAGFELY